MSLARRDGGQALQRPRAHGPLDARRGGQFTRARGRKGEKASEGGTEGRRSQPIWPNILRRQEIGKTEKRRPHLLSGSGDPT